jgi:hypothetical protein
LIYAFGAVCGPWAFHGVFPKLRDGVKRGRIRCSVRIWQSPHVKAGGKYPMDDGHIVVDSIEKITIKDITHDLALRVRRLRKRHRSARHREARPWTERLPD